MAKNKTKSKSTKTGNNYAKQLSAAIQKLAANSNANLNANAQPGCTGTIKPRTSLPLLVHTSIVYDGLKDEFSDFEFEKEPTLFKGSVGFTYRHGGRIAKTCLDYADDICQQLHAEADSSYFYLNSATRSCKNEEIVVTVEKKYVEIGDYFHKKTGQWNNSSHYYLLKNMANPYTGAAIISMFFGPALNTNFTSVRGKRLLELTCKYLNIDYTDIDRVHLNEAVQTIKIPDLVAFFQSEIPDLKKDHVFSTQVKHGNAVHYFPATILNGLMAEVSGWAVEVQMQFGKNLQAQNMIL